MWGPWHGHRHGFEVGGTNSCAKRRKFFLACPLPPPKKKCVVSFPNFGGTAEDTTVEKSDIVIITRVKNKTLLTWQLADIHDVLQNKLTPPEI